MALSRNVEVRLLADQLERSFQGGAWHGPAIREALKGIDAATADRRPDGSSHAIVELVRHITFWMDASYRRIAGGRDVDPRADWTKRDTLTAEVWIRTVAELEQAHTNLQKALLDIEDDRLDDAIPGTDPTVRGLLLGTLQHNAYHTGQIVQIARELV
jgi:uncharacterized damage-inducible protein DinB